MPKILQLKISLCDSKPLIWRRFLVEDSLSFHELHEIIQIVMGWGNYHLYNFQVGDTLIEADTEDSLFVDAVWTTFRPKTKTESVSETKLDKFIKREKQKFKYLYDFGDSWEHTITVEKILKKASSQRYPVCIAGKMTCPPEDCGGIWGYANLLEIRKDKNHPDYEERIVEWLGEDFDPEEFDINEVNKLLQKSGENSMKVNYRLKRLTVDVVENQLKENTPKATKETFERLISRGYDEKTAKEMIASVLLENIYHMLKENQKFDEEEFAKKLSKLQ